MSPAEEERLMRYFDGELDAAEAARVEQWLAQDAEARALARDFALIGEAVRGVAAERGEGAADIAAGVMARLPPEEPAVRKPELHAVPGAPGSRRRRPAWVGLAPAVGLALAAAAAVVVFLRPAPRPNVTGAGSAVPVVVGAPEGTPAVPAESEGTAAAESETGASIETIDFGGQHGSIFMVASGPDVTPVVWLEDEGDESGDRMQPL